MEPLSELIPPESQQLFELHYVVEVGLREFCIAVLAARYGPRFWREHLPADLVAKMRAQLHAQRADWWKHIAPQHPLVYLDLPDLIRVLDDDERWEAVFSYHFRIRGTLMDWLGRLAQSRATLQAYRRPTDDELYAASTAHYELSRGVGSQWLHSLLQHPTSADDRWALLNALERELEEQERRWRAGEALLPTSAWEQVAAAWWFDHDYVGASVDVLTAYIGALAAYTRLIDEGVSGAEARAWAAEQDLASQAAKALGELYVIRAMLGDQ